MLTITVAICASFAASADDFPALRDAYLAKFKPLWMESSASWWEANITGDDKAFERKKIAEKALTELHADKAAFAKFKAIKETGAVTDAVQARELDVIYRAYLGGQGDPELQKR